MDDDSWPDNLTGGGTNAVFVTGQAGDNPLPGSPFNEGFDADPDDDYYFAGVTPRLSPAMALTPRWVPSTPTKRV